MLHNTYIWQFLILHIYVSSLINQGSLSRDYLPIKILDQSLSEILGSRKLHCTETQKGLSSYQQTIWSFHLCICLCMHVSTYVHIYISFFIFLYSSIYLSIIYRMILVISHLSSTSFKGLLLREFGVLIISFFPSIHLSIYLHHLSQRRVWCSNVFFYLHIYLSMYLFVFQFAERV